MSRHKTKLTIEQIENAFYFNKNSQNVLLEIMSELSIYNCNNPITFIENYPGCGECIVCLSKKFMKKKSDF